MREVDSMGRDACAFQGRVFEASATELGTCGSAVFIRRFMRSDVARRVDRSGAFDVGAVEAAVVHEVDVEYGERPYGSAVFPPDVLYWIGYLYRYWCLAADASSRQVHGACGANEMRDLYPAYHTMDPAQCVERILEAKGLPSAELNDEQAMRRGVEALRRIRGR